MYFYTYVLGLYVTLDFSFIGLLFINYFKYGLLILSFIVLLFRDVILVS